MKKKATGKGRKRTQAVGALLEARTIAEAAEACKITPRTLLNWLGEPEFQAEYRSAKDQMLEGAINRLRVAGFDAARRLHQIAIDTKAPLPVVVSAAARLLELLLK